MLSDRDREVFEELVQQLDDEESSAAPSTAPSTATRTTSSTARGSRIGARHPGLLEAAVGLGVVAISVSGLLGSPEAVVSFTGAVAVLSMIRYA